MTRLDDEKKILKKVLQEEKRIEKEEKKIDAEEENIEKKEKFIRSEEYRIEEKEDKIEKEEKEIEKVIRDKVVTLKFTDVFDWKEKIWNNCPHKILNEETSEISYNCAKLKNVCKFSECPLNRL